MSTENLQSGDIYLHSENRRYEIKGREHLMCYLLMGNTFPLLRTLAVEDTK